MEERNVTIYAAIPYEGEHQVFYGRETDAVEWLKNPDRYYNLDDLQAYYTGPDIYEMVNRQENT
jgi:hypothetical protein